MDVAIENKHTKGINKQLLRNMVVLLIVAIPLLLLSNIPGVVQSQSDRRCFPETGYCISGTIRIYWERYGGLPVFGYPTTPQREETVEGTWTGQVQWFERDRLEDHGSEGVMAGRLGADILERWGTPWNTFPFVSNAPSGCEYFQITGHSLCEPFLSYWRNNGGLERFGYPITEPFESTIENWTGKVQYFERRRMEHHTELAGTSYEVLLGLLGNEIRAMDSNKTPIPTLPTATKTITPTVTPSATPTPTIPIPTTPTPTNTPAPTLSISKFATISQGSPNDQFSYNISVKLSDTTDQTVNFQDHLDANLEIIASRTDRGACGSSGQIVNCTLTVRNSASATVNIQVKIRENTPEGTIISNIASASKEGISAVSELVVVRVIGQPNTPTPSPVSPTPSPKPTATNTPIADSSDFVRRVTERTNTYRKQAGCSQLQIDNRLTKAAQDHTTDMALNDYFSHTGLNGSTPWDRIKNAGFDFSTAAENIYGGAKTPEDAVDAWYQSEGHRQNMLNCRLQYIGVGYYALEKDTGNVNYHTYWTQVFATP